MENEGLSPEDRERECDVCHEVGTGRFVQRHKGTGLKRLACGPCGGGVFDETKKDE